MAKKISKLARLWLMSEFIYVLLQPQVIIIIVARRHEELKPGIINYMQVYLIDVRYLGGKKEE